LGSGNQNAPWAAYELQRPKRVLFLVPSAQATSSHSWRFNMWGQSLAQNSIQVFNLLNGL
jgi:hypothetical protein